VSTTRPAGIERWYVENTWKYLRRERSRDFRFSLDLVPPPLVAMPLTYEDLVVPDRRKCPF
jgi:hypothetical protein